METVTEFEDSLSRIPFVCTTRISAARTKRHVRHGDLVDEICGVLGGNQTTCWRSLPGNDLSQCGSSTLTWISCPDDGVDLQNQSQLCCIEHGKICRTDLLVIFDSGTVYLPASELHHDEGFSNRRKLSNEIHLVTGPGDVHAIATFAFYRFVDSACKNDRIGGTRSGHGSSETRCARAGNSGSLRIGGLEACVKCTLERTDDEWGRSLVVSLKVASSVCERADECDILDRLLEGQGSVVLE